MESFNRRDLLPDPLALFSRWYQQALDSGIVYPYNLALATAGHDNIPFVRMVLLRGFDDEGFHFFTNYESRKAVQLSENPRAALLFYWEKVNRQIRIQALVEKLPASDSDRYFASRPIENQLAAWASRQSQPVENRAELEEFLREARQKFGNSVPRPPYWGGYLARPYSYEFWQGRSGRLHDRFLYTRDTRDGWRIQRLAP